MKLLILFFYVTECPSPPTTGSLTSTSSQTIADCFIEGDTVTYSCLSGEQLVGLNVNECLPGGFWSLPNVVDLPTCASRKRFQAVFRRFHTILAKIFSAFWFFL